MLRAVTLTAGVLAATTPAAAQPADVSMGFAFGGSVPTVAGEVTEHMNGRLAVVGGAYWGSRPDASTVGFCIGPRLYTEPAGRLRPFGDLAFGFSQSSGRARGLALTHALTFTPGLGVEVGIGTRTRVRTAAGYGLALGGVGDGTGFNVTTALVLIPARE